MVQLVISVMADSASFSHGNTKPKMAPGIQDNFWSIKANF